MNTVEDSNYEYQIKAYLDAIRCFGENTDDYLYVYEIRKNRLWFSGNAIREKYNLLKDGKEYCSPDEWFSIVYPPDIKFLKESTVARRWNKKNTYNINYRILDKDKNPIWVNNRGKLRFDEAGKPFVLVGRVSDVVLKQMVDPLTNLFNKTKLLEDGKNAQNSGIRGYFLLVGIDDLRKINIKYGWDYGNRIIMHVAKTLNELSQGKYGVYRMDGDCLAVRLVNATKEETQNFFDEAQKILSLTCTISGGSAEFKNKKGEAENAYQYAEEALSKSKKVSKAMLQFFSEEDYKKKIADTLLLDELNQSVKNGFRGFSLCYQPQIKSSVYDLFGAEALLRYNSPSAGRQMPDRFIPMLENSGLIYPVGLWVLETALKQCAVWRKNSPKFHISVNVSYVQLKNSHITRDVLDKLYASGLPGSALTIEITESMQLQDYEHFNEIVSAWKEEGIEISVDDFGTGYSSLAYLKNLAVDEIKIDKSFVSKVYTNTYNYLLLKNMIDLADSTQIRVCCEGVEDDKELQVLEELNPFLFQGYLFSKPCEKKDFEKLFFNGDNSEYKELRKKISGIQKKNFDRFLNFKPLEVLKATEVGLWIMRIDKKAGVYEMYADETMRHVMGASDKNLSPEEYYQFWYSRINSGYYSHVLESLDRMAHDGSIVQFQYTWIHPELGDVLVRGTGARIEYSDGMVCLQGYHRMINNLVQPEFIKKAVMAESFDYDENRGMIYFHSERSLLAGEEIHEENFPESWIKKNIVHPHFASDFRKIFIGVDKKDNFDNMELMLKTKHGDYGWFKLSARHLGLSEDEKSSLFVQLVQEDNERLVNLENMRIKDFYRASLSDSIAYAELDMECGWIQELGGLWKKLENEFEGKVDNLLQYLSDKRNECAGEDSYIGVEKEYSGEGLRKFIESETDKKTRFVIYKSIIEGTERWVKLVIHTFKDNFSGSVYALLCLKDVDERIKNEIVLKEVAEKDSLTHLLNRKSFEKHIDGYLDFVGRSGEGVYILFDIDNFKSINDKFGHLKGDEILKKTAHILFDTFNETGVVGRYGGDEFQVFIKGAQKREKIESVMVKLYKSLEEMNLHCSAGVVFVTAKKFSFNEMFSRADDALYWCKKNGKSKYKFHEDFKKEY